jgi:hypothetical protein
MKSFKTRTALSELTEKAVLLWIKISGGCSKKSRYLNKKS